MLTLIYRVKHLSMHVGSFFPLSSSAISLEIVNSESTASLILDEDYIDRPLFVHHKAIVCLMGVILH